MKPKAYLFVGVIMLTMLVAAFNIGQAYATTGCFLDTVGNPFEAYICWLKDNGITTGTGGGNYSPNDGVTRAQMAAFLQRQAEVPPSTGNILISAGFNNWVPFNSTDPISYTYFSSQMQATRSSIGSSFLSVNPDVPVALYGRTLRLKGVQFCYDTFASTQLTYVELNTYTHTTGSLGRNLRFSDPTLRSGNHCDLFMLGTPVDLTINDGVNFFIQVKWNVASAQFAVGRTTFIFEATSNLAPAPAAPTLDGNETILQPAPEGANVPDTAAP